MRKYAFEAWPPVEVVRMWLRRAGLPIHDKPALADLNTRLQPGAGAQPGAPARAAGWESAPRASLRWSAGSERINLEIETLAGELAETTARLRELEFEDRPLP